VSFATLYRVSFYLMLVIASLVMSIDAADNRFAMLYPVAVACAGAIAFLTVDRPRREVAVSNSLLNTVALASVSLSVVEYAIDNSLLLLALGHWLIYLEMVLLFRSKSQLEDWELFLLGLVQVMVGTVISQSDSVGLMLFCWAVLALWVLGLFSLQRDSVRARGASPAGGEPAAEPYPGLLNLAFVMSALRVTLTTLALGGVIFLAMPRTPTMARSRSGDLLAQHLTGFDDEVELGQMGEILENDSVVMTVEMFDENESRVVPQGEPLWRGVTMAVYDNGRWKRQGKQNSTFPIFNRPRDRRPGSDPSRGLIRQRIKLEANDSNVLFGLRPMLDASPVVDASANRNYGPLLNSIDGTISRPFGRGRAFDYEVRSFRDAEIPQPGEVAPGAYLKRLTGMPEGLRPRLKAIATRVIDASVPPDRRDDRRAQAQALAEYLGEGGRFGYTLKLDVVDRTIDPVEDFLVNRKQGHCEYFASALTLLLRSLDIPARMVNGFKGGDPNGLALMTIVRQKHAHSWVEAYLGPKPGAPREPIWLTLDPTPGLARDESVARVGGFRTNFRQITDAIRYVWVFYVVGYNAERQNALLYTPIRALMREASRGFGIMAESYEGMKARLLALLHFPDVQSFISVRGFLVSFVALLILAGLVRGAAWLVRQLVGDRRGRGERSAALSAGAAHYRRLALLLEGYGLERPPAETQDEYAHRAALFLNGLGTSTTDLAEVPRLVVEAFYRVRFGHLDLSPQSAALLESRIDALEASLTASRL